MYDTWKTKYLICEYEMLNLGILPTCEWNFAIGGGAANCTNCTAQRPISHAIEKLAKVGFHLRFSDCGA